MRDEQRPIAHVGARQEGGEGARGGTVRAPGPDGGSAMRPSPVLVLLFVVVASYAAFGKGFAYAGVPPVFVGEVVLVVVVVAVLVRPTPLPRHAAAAIAVGVAARSAVQLAIDRLDPAAPLVETLRGLAPIYDAPLAYAANALPRSQAERDGREERAG